MTRYLVVLFCCAISAFAADLFCPWFDAATASGVLGGPVTSRVTVTSCEFTRAHDKLRIEVHRAPAASEDFARLRARCGAAAEPLKGTGNEAFLCSKTHEVVGRVRDAVFGVRLSAPDWEAKAKPIAEQVAGALF